MSIGSRERAYIVPDCRLTVVRLSFDRRKYLLSRECLDMKCYIDTNKLL